MSDEEHIPPDQMVEALQVYIEQLKQQIVLLQQENDRLHIELQRARIDLARPAPLSPTAHPPS